MFLVQPRLRRGQPGSVFASASVRPLVASELQRARFRPQSSQTSSTFTVGLGGYAQPLATRRWLAASRAWSVRLVSMFPLGAAAGEDRGVGDGRPM